MRWLIRIRDRRTATTVVQLSTWQRSARMREEMLLTSHASLAIRLAICPRTVPQSRVLREKSCAISARSQDTFQEIALKVVELLLRALLVAITAEASVT